MSLLDNMKDKFLKEVLLNSNMEEKKILKTLLKNKYHNTNEIIDFLEKKPLDYIDQEMKELMINQPYKNIHMFLLETTAKKDNFLTRQEIEDVYKNSKSREVNEMCEIQLWITI